MDSLPDVLTVAPRHSGIEMALSVPQNAWYFKGHFPQFPLVPGVLLLGWARIFARKYLAIDAPLRGVTRLKFLKQLEPGTRITLNLETQRREADTLVRFEYRSKEYIACSGVLRL